MRNARYPRQITLEEYQVKENIREMRGILDILPGKSTQYERIYEKYEVSQMDYLGGLPIKNIGEIRGRVPSEREYMRNARNPRQITWEEYLVKENIREMRGILDRLPLTWKEYLVKENI